MWRTFLNVQQGRLDFFFFFNVRGANVDVNMVKVNPSYLSDHSLVILELKTEGRREKKKR